MSLLHVTDVQERHLSPAVCHKLCDVYLYCFIADQSINQNLLLQLPVLQHQFNILFLTVISYSVLVSFS